MTTKQSGENSRRWMSRAFERGVWRRCATRSCDFSLTFPISGEGVPSPGIRGGGAGGFTLVELLICVGIIALLLALVMPALGRAREAGRGASCAASLHQAGLAMAMYLDDNDGSFFPYYQDISGPGGGRRWWFGFERGGPAMNPATRNRPLDKAAGFLGRYLSGSSNDLLCPSFPFAASNFFRKFAVPAGGYGYNTGALGGFNLLDPALVRPRKIQEFVGRTSEVFSLADGIHFDRLDFSSTPPLAQSFNEPPFMQWQSPAQFGSNVGVNGGFGHFRHGGRATVLYLDGHAAAQPLRRPAHPYTAKGIGPIGNLSDEALRVKDVQRGNTTLAVDLIYGP
jgi:prepilin-type processing-associated H-X9-DG protein/prepilin-type N-terminal cleavage/methylation domain-containing protein